MPGNIFSDKELAQTFQPLLLCEFTFPDGTILRVSTHPLSATYGGSPTGGSYEYAGSPWYPRVLNQDIGATQAMSDIGVEIVPQVTVTLADPDKTLYLAWEFNKGFKGAILKLYAVMFDAGSSLTGSFSSNMPAPIKFIGTCNSPFFDEKTMTVTATSLLNMAQMQMPPLRIQQRCGWTFPTNENDQSAAFSNDASIFWECGYSPKFLGSGGVGNFESGTAAFTNCDYGYDACIARLGNSAGVVPIEKDEAGNFTGRFGGYRWIPNQQGGLSRSYLTGKWEEIVNASNEARYGDFIPMCYGTTWVEPLVMGVWGDANYTNFEVMLCYGEISAIRKIVVNGTEVPRIDPDDDPGHRPSDNTIPSDAVSSQFKNGYWKTINRGFKNGVPSPLPGWGRLGDPYGSIAVIYVSVLRSVAQENSIPKIQVLLEGQKIRVYNDQEDLTAYTKEFTGNPAWILMDLLTWANWKHEDIDILSFITAAIKCDTQIYFTRMDGTYANTYLESGSPAYRRFSVGFSVRQRVAIGELIRGIRNSMKAMLFFDYTTGKLKLIIKETIASQQPDAIVGSNYTSVVPSVTVEGVEQDGHIAYRFDHTNIQKTEEGRSTLQITQRTNQEAANKVTVVFQNRENSYSQDTATVVDAEDVSRLGQEVFGSFPLQGVQTFDHVRRITNTWFAEGYRGNYRLDYEGSAIGDTGGTLMFDFILSIKALHLMVGQICILSDVQHNIENQPVRVMKIQPSTNFETAKVTVSWHNDNWYQDSFGQVNQPKYGRPRSIIDRKPFAWRADYETPIVDDAYYTIRDKNFGIRVEYEQTADSQIARVRLIGKIPVNRFPDQPGRPKLELTGVGTAGGGYPQSTTYYVALASKQDSTTASLISAVGKPAIVKLNDTQSALHVTVQAWFDHPSGYFVFVGDDPFSMTFQAEASGTAAVVDLAGIYNQASWGAPDEAFANFRWRVRREVHSGVWAAVPNQISPTGFVMDVFQNFGFTVNQWAGREISLLGLTSAALWVPIANFPVSGNSVNTIYLSGGNPTTARQGDPIIPGDIVTMRMLPTYDEDENGHYFEDLGWVNIYNFNGDLLAVQDASNTSPIVIRLGQVGADFPFEDGNEVLVQFVEGNVAANGLWFIDNCDPALGTFELVGSTGDGDYTKLGWAAYHIDGLAPDAEKGHIAFIIAGTGRGTYATIKSNTATRIYIDGDWVIPPDETTRIVILEQTPLVDRKSDRINNRTPRNEGNWAVDVTNFLGQTVFVEALTESVNASHNPEPLTPFRELYIKGNSTPLSFILTEKDRATFGVGIGQAQTIGSDLTNHFMVRQPDGGGQLIEAIANCKTPGPTALDPLIFQIWKTSDEGGLWYPLFKEDNMLTIPTGSTEQVHLDVFALAPNNRVDPGDWLRIDLMAGSNEDSMDIEVVLRWGDPAAVS